MNTLIFNSKNSQTTSVTYRFTEAVKSVNWLIRLNLLVIMLLALVSAAWAGNTSLKFVNTSLHEKVFTGTSQPLGAGKIRSWVKSNHGELTAIGVAFDENALKNLPAEPPAGQEGTEYVLALPPEAANTVFTHIGVNWNPHGHGPTKIYDVGHFDFHFYLISEKERGLITAKGEDLKKTYKPLPTDSTPAGYVLAPDSAIAKMGAHWADPNSHEFHGHEFTKTLLYGSYDGKIIFVEPMITRAFLETKPNFTEEIKLPAKFPKSGLYPTKYSVRYEAATKEYTVALEAMTLR